MAALGADNIFGVSPVEYSDCSTHSSFSICTKQLLKASWINPLKTKRICFI
jgi:hypothetical protein